MCVETKHIGIGYVATRGQVKPENITTLTRQFYMGFIEKKWVNNPAILFS